MTVAGFGAGSNEVKEAKLIPGMLTAYRMFRFRPRPSSATPFEEWSKYARDGSAYFSPCLTPAAFPQVAYDRPGTYNAVCNRRPTTYQTYQVATINGGVEEFIGMDRHSAPSLNCQCGFWAYYTPEIIDTGNGTEWMALAAVQVSGNVVLGDKGVRAEKMEIVALQIPGELLGADQKVVDAWIELTAKLKVPYFWAKSELLKFHPPQDVSELIPKPEPAPQYPFGSPYYSYHYPIGRQPRWAIDPLLPQYVYPAGGQVHYTNIPTVANPAPVTVTNIGSSLVFDTKCCVCSFSFAASSQVELDKAVATHIIENHP